MSYEGHLRKIVLFVHLFHNLMSIKLDTCFPGGTVVKKNPLANAGDVGLIPGSEDPLETELATCSSVLA